VRRKISAQVDGGGRAEGLVCADPGARTPIGMSGIIYSVSFVLFTICRKNPPTDVQIAWNGKIIISLECQVFGD
jgi:hypothetical protein